MKTARGTCFPAPVSLKNVLKLSSPPPMVLSDGICPSGWIPCSRQYNSQQALPIWTPACPTWIEIHSRCNREKTLITQNNYTIIVNQGIIDFANCESWMGGAGRRKTVTKWRPIKQKRRSAFLNFAQENHQKFMTKIEKKILSCTIEFLKTITQLKSFNFRYKITFEYELKANFLWHIFRRNHRNKIAHLRFMN